MIFPWIDNSEKLIETLSKLESNSKAVWGRMDAQQMIEHLILVCNLSNKKCNTEIITPEKYLSKTQEFLMGEEPMPKNFVAKFIPEDPIPYTFKNIEKAKTEFINAIDKYHLFWAAKPNGKLNHPIFGSLTHHMWNQVHNKHIRHHLKQFDLIK